MAPTKKANVSAKLPAPAPAPTTKSVKATAAKPDTSKVVASASAPAPAPTPVAVPANDTVATVVEPTVMSRLASKIVAAVTMLKEIQGELKVAQKEFDKLNKTKLKAEKKRANARTTPSGFAKPTKISDELCDFLNVPKGTEMARTEVTRKLNAYIKENGLFDQANKRKILPNAALKKLLGSEDGDDVSYFNVQRYMKRHFIKA